MLRDVEDRLKNSICIEQNFQEKKNKRMKETQCLRGSMTDNFPELLRDMNHRFLNHMSSRQNKLN